MKKIILLLLLVATTAAAQKSTDYLIYIERYAPLAVEQMQRYKIPASITLAQGLHESGAGKSRLATKANNHFGIKVGSDWTGPYIVHSDDRPNDRFRKYNSVAESYRDHSLFLQKSRYSRLFQLKITDYKGWAHGLKACGYATNPSYAQIIIKIIETYNLQYYDTGKWDVSAATSVATTTSKPGYTISTPRPTATQNQPSSKPEGVELCNKNYYVTVKEGDCLATIARRTNVSPTRLIKYNELTESYVLTVGDRLYLKKKRSKAEAQYKNKPHIVKAGESMHSISQLYGIRIKSLYKLNKLQPSYVPTPGDRLKVR